MPYLVKFTTLESTTALAAVAATPNEPEPRLNPFGKGTVVLTPGADFRGDGAVRISRRAVTKHMAGHGHTATDGGV